MQGELNKSIQIHTYWSADIFYLPWRYSSDFKIILIFCNTQNKITVQPITVGLQLFILQNSETVIFQST